MKIERGNKIVDKLLKILYYWKEGNFMRLGIIILLILAFLWLLSLGFSEKVGDFFTKLVIDPIKDLFK